MRTERNVGEVCQLLRRIFTAFLASLSITATAFAATSSGPPSPLPTATDPAAAALSRVVARNASLHDYTFDVAVHVALVTFPWIRFSMSGHGEYIRNGVYAVHFDQVPWFGHGFETMSMTALDPANWPQQYTIALAKPEGNHVILSMRSRNRSPLRDTLVTIDSDETVRQILWEYSYGGHVVLHIEPTPVSGYLLPMTEEAEISVPGYRAVADATFSNYRVNSPQAQATQPSVISTATAAH